MEWSKHQPNAPTASNVPEPYREHPLVQGNEFHCIPHRLLDLTLEEVGVDRFDQERVELEKALTAACTGSSVGFWRGGPIDYPLLSQQPIEIREPLRKELGWTSKQVAAVAGSGADRLARLQAVALGYAGWLMLNREFLAQRDQLWTQWSPEVDASGVPRMGVVLSGADQFAEVEGSHPSNLRAFSEAFERFFVHWRLAGMSAPQLPLPLQPLLPVAHLPQVLGHMRHGGETFYLPDIFPVPSRDELRDVLEEALRAEPPEHLAGWTEIVKGDNPAKTAISRYGRLFQLQHYVRSLYSRHAEALHRKKASLEIALAHFFGVSEDTIHRDLARIAESLGSGWCEPEA